MNINSGIGNNSEIATKGGIVDNKGVFEYDFKNINN
jgi:hypothetical protein